MKVFVAFFLIAILLVSGCSLPQKPPSNQTAPTSAALADICKSGGSLTSFTLDPQGPSLSRVDAAQALQAKCTVFGKCSLETAYNLFKLYALSLSSENENKLLNKTDFKAYISIDADVGSQNKTTLKVADKTYELSNIAKDSVMVDGKLVNKGETFKLDGFDMKYFDYKEQPVFLVLLIKGGDVKEVIEDPDHSGVRVDQNGFGAYSILIRFSDSVSERFYMLVKDMQTIIDYTKNGPQAILKSKIYYYVDNAFITSAPLPSEVKTEDRIDKISILGIENNPEDAYKEYKFISSSLKLYTFPEIKILNREQIDCRDVLDSKS